MIRSFTSMLVAAMMCVVTPLVGACSPIAVSSAPAAVPAPLTPLERATLAYARVRIAALEAVPFLPADQAQHVRDTIALADVALQAAQQAASSTDRLHTLTELATAVATVVGVVAGRHQP